MSATRRRFPFEPGLAAILAGTLAACGPPDPGPLARVLAVSPNGAGVEPGLPEVLIDFSAPVDSSSVLEAPRVALVPSSLVREAIQAIEAEPPGTLPPEAVPLSARLDGGGARLVLALAVPLLRPRTAYAVVISSRLRSADGRPVLDAEGRRRPTTSVFETGKAPGPPPLPIITEVRADAATPEAAGEYVEISNFGEGLLFLAGFRLSKRTPSGAKASCIIDSEVAVGPGAAVVVAGTAYDGRYAPTPVATCGGATLLGGLANTTPPEIRLLDPDGALLSSFGVGGAPPCPAAIERIAPDAPDEPASWRCAPGEGTPGVP